MGVLEHQLDKQTDNWKSVRKGSTGIACIGGVNFIRGVRLQGFGV